MRNKVIATAVILFFMATGFLPNLINNWLQNYRAATAVLQLENSNEAAALGRAAAQSTNVVLYMWLIVLIVLFLIWRKEIGQMWKKFRSSSTVAAFFFAAFVSLFLSGCGPAYVEPLVTIEANETAFLIPATGANLDNQAQFDSVGFLEANKVAKKRISMPVEKHVTGRMWWDYEYVTTDFLIKVNRTPVTRIWSPDIDQDSSGQDEGFDVESLESVGFSVGIVATGLILEEDAAKFLYYFAGKPLSEVMDENVRGYIQTQLFMKFGALAVMDAVNQKNTIIEQVFEETRVFFDVKGVSIESLGGQGGIVFDDIDIQNALDEILVAEQAMEKAQKMQEAIGVENETAKLVAENNALIRQIEAEAQAKATITLATAEAEALTKKGQALASFPGLTAQTIAENSNGDVPETLVVVGEGVNLPFAWNLPEQQTAVAPTAGQ